MDKQVGSFVHLALYRELAKAADVADAKYIDEFAVGLPIVGKVALSGRWPPLEGALEPEMTIEEIDARAWELQDKIKRRVERHCDAEMRQTLWQNTMADTARGQCMGPFWTKAEVSQQVGTDAWIPTERFGLVQKNKTRGIDNAAKGAGLELNAATAATEKLKVTSTDANVGLIREMHARLGRKMVEAWVLDESDAYRQIPVAPEHRRYAVIALANPETGRAAYFVMVGHSFGLVAAVYDYNRRSAIITDILKKAFGILARNYYDDKFGFTRKGLAAQECRLVADLHWWLGADYARKKLQTGQDVTILGIRYDLIEMCLEVTEQRKQELIEAIEESERKNLLTPAYAGKLKGRLEHVAAHLWGRFGRSFLRPLSERQWQKSQDHQLGRALRRCLSFWRWLLTTRGVPRSLVNKTDGSSDVVAFTDGYYPAPRETSADPLPRVGWLLIDKRSGQALTGMWSVPCELIAKWLPRKTQICMVEAFAAVLLVDQYRHLLRNRKLILFVDADAVLAALVKGYSA